MLDRCNISLRLSSYQIYWNILFHRVDLIPVSLLSIFRLRSNLVGRLFSHVLSCLKRRLTEFRSVEQITNECKLAGIVVISIIFQVDICMMTEEIPKLCDVMLYIPLLVHISIYNRCKVIMSNREAQKKFISTSVSFSFKTMWEVFWMWLGDHVTVA